MLQRYTVQSWTLGRLVVYASSLHIARQAYELVVRHPDHGACGTVVLRSGDEVQWIDTRLDSVPSHGEQE